MDKQAKVAELGEKLASTQPESREALEVMDAIHDAGLEREVKEYLRESAAALETEALLLAAGRS